MSDADFRPLSEWETGVLDRMLQVKFSGREQLLSQRDGLMAKTLDENGSLRFKVQSSKISPVNGLVVEGRFPDFENSAASAPAVNVLLHVKEGRLWMLEVYREDGAKISARPDPKRLVTFTAKPAAG